MSIALCRLAGGYGVTCDVHPQITEQPQEEGEPFLNDKPRNPKEIEVIIIQIVG